MGRRGSARNEVPLKLVQAADARLSRRWRLAGGAAAAAVTAAATVAVAV